MAEISLGLALRTGACECGGLEGCTGGCQESDGCCEPKPQEHTHSLLHSVTLVFPGAQFQLWESHCVRVKAGNPKAWFPHCDLQVARSPSLTPSSLCLSLSSTDGIYYGDNRFNTVSESGTATLKARPRVRPLLTFIPLVSMLSAQASTVFRVGHLTCQKWSRSATSASPTVHSLPS